MTTFPTVLQRVVDAAAAERACDSRAHPRISKKLWGAFSDARKELRKSYPEIEEWLFGYPYRKHPERLAELQRLMKGEA